MKNLVFKSLYLLSDQQKRAAKFQFGDRFNLIMGKADNSVGKTSLVKSLFWSFGCNPNLDELWKDLDCKALIEFSIDGKLYYLARYGDNFFFSEDKRKYTYYHKVFGDFSLKFAELMNFNALLPQRDKNIVVTPPPAYYFIPFYIDQKLSWAKAWTSFDNLQQFAYWQKEIIPYHVGITRKNYFDKTKILYELRRNKELVIDDIKRIDSALSVLSEYIPETTTTVNLDELEKIKFELKEDVYKLHKRQENIFEELANLKAKKASLEIQQKIALEAINELEKDYEYSQKLEEEILCPTCGTMHDNSLVEKFTLLSDKSQTEQVVERLNKQIDRTERNIEIKTRQLDDLRNEIQIINDKYFRDGKENLFTLQNILDSVAAQSVKTKVTDSKEMIEIQLIKLSTQEIEIDNDRKDSIKERRKMINDDFLNIYPQYISKLRADGINPNKIKSLENYNKIANSGGAAEGVRGMLAYYICIFNLIAKYSEEVLAPLVIDTPNQHEQAPHHYDSIVSFIKDNTPHFSQIFLCALDSPKLDILKNDSLSKTIFLEEPRSLLSESNYSDIKEEIGWIFEGAALS